MLTALSFSYGRSAGQKCFSLTGDIVTDEPN